MKVLIALDPSDCSQAAVDAVIDRPWPQDTEMLAVTVVEPLNIGYIYVDSYSVAAVESAQRELFSERSKHLSSQVEKLKTVPGVLSVGEKVIDGYIADAIVTAARNFDADMIVLGSHGRHGLNRVLLGSVAEKVAACAPCSVEIVRPRQPVH